MQTQADLLTQIRLHGQTTYPEECCGFLLGKVTAEGNHVAAIYRVENEQDTHRDRRYIISPKNYLAADRAAQKQGLDIVGIYHSHPDHPAAPSETDLAWATFPGYTYVIVSVLGGRAAELTAWSLTPNRERFVPEDIRTEGPPP